MNEYTTKIEKSAKSHTKVIPKSYQSRNGVIITTYWNHKKIFLKPFTKCNGAIKKQLIHRYNNKPKRFPVFNRVFFIEYFRS
jgi:hypothetical protein